ncbi:sensor histidine kinase [Paraburkholderia sp.]|uniref:sensor histidine kinase n=1 Tax=Paraburkholderia sp. TaxID=1926495 RepID=UPI003D6F4507
MRTRCRSTSPAHGTAPRWFQGLSTRLWLTSVAALALCLGLLATVGIQTLSTFPQQTVGRHSQIEVVQRIVDALVYDAAGQPVAVQLSDPTAWMFEAIPTELKYRVTDEHGTVLLVSPGKYDGPWIDRPGVNGEPTIEETTLNGRPFYIATLRFVHTGRAFRVQTAASARFTTILAQERIRALTRIVNVVFFIATIIFGLSLTLMLRRVLKPLRQVSEAAALITPRNLTTRLSPSGLPHEIRPLIDGFNEALDRLENGFIVQQQFLASAAHELQTPLTLIRGQIELQPDIHDKDTLLREIDLMARQVRQLLHLAEVSEAQNFSFADVATADVAQDVLAYLARKAETMHVGLHLESTQTSPSIWADRSALFILLKNVVENAINVSPPDGSVRVIVDAHSIQVRDEGPGIDEAYLPFIFKRFWRAPGARHHGAGLGLAICREIAVAHGWRIAVSRLTVGTGFAVRFDDAAPAP